MGVKFVTDHASPAILLILVVLYFYMPVFEVHVPLEKRALHSMLVVDILWGSWCVLEVWIRNMYIIMYLGLYGKDECSNISLIDVCRYMYLKIVIYAYAGPISKWSTCRSPCIILVLESWKHTRRPWGSKVGYKEWKTGLYVVYNIPIPTSCAYFFSSLPPIG